LQHRIERAAKAGGRGRSGRSIRGAPRFSAAPVANSSSVSLVEVSLSTVMR
jgi:hypothetical protein